MASLKAKYCADIICIGQLISEDPESSPRLYLGAKAFSKYLNNVVKIKRLLVSILLSVHAKKHN